VIGADEVMGAVVSINATTIVEGKVDSMLMVVNGTATVNGTVGGDLVVINGTLNLGDSAVVDNVTLVSSEMNRAEGATITGTLDEEANVTAFSWGIGIFSVVFWFGTTLVLLLAGLLFVAVGGKHVPAMARTMTARPMETIVAALVAGVGVPLLAVLAFVTVIGIPLSFTIFLVVMPLLALLGFLVAGERLGLWLSGLMNLGTSRYVPVVVGLLALQVIGLIPWFGGLLSFLATMLGGGALVYYLYQRFQHRREPRAVMPVAPAPVV
jgi:hypothetical protein